MNSTTYLSSVRRIQENIYKYFKKTQEIETVLGKKRRAYELDEYCGEIY